MAGARHGVVLMPSQGDGFCECEDSCFNDGPRRERQGYHYVGHGHGSFSQVNEMEFVGRGRGNYEKQHRTLVQGYQCRPQCVAIASGALLVATIFIIAAILHAQNAQNAAADDATPGIFRHPGNVRGTGAYDCNLGFEHWREAWTLRHQRWCCFSENKACAEKIVHHDHYIQVIRHGDAMHGHFSHRIAASYDPEADNQIYDCTMGIPSWQSLWSQSKKVWCCDHSHGEVMLPLRSYCCTSLHIGCQDGYHRKSLD
ncbi:unnamed protein product [Cladocopium goreaui]|uniref:Cellulase n=1 Tax=Cladocopium goreaui TaxID=2562237 RepID=A0A9P1FRZ3_9DINO|nr:unnamed protein product [Cladocopium goreaui]